MTNNTDIVEALEGVEAWEHDDQRELSRLYNHKPDDSPQFNRGQMRVAIRHGKRLALASLQTDAPEAQEEGLVGRLRQHRVILKSGDYDGGDLMRAWCDMATAADEIERLTALSRNHDEALERAAKVAEDDECEDWTDGVARGGIIAEKIRALKGDSK